MNSAKISIIKKYVITKYVLIKECEGIKHMKTTELEKKKNIEDTVKRFNVMFKAQVLFIFPLLVHVRWVPLSPQHGASLDCGWKGRPPALEVSCEYNE
jgi:hypothetical protein